jgi:galactonate dehydratase
MACALTLEACAVSAKTQWVFTRLIDRQGRTGFGEATLNGSEAALVAAADTLAPALWQAKVEEPGAFAAVLAPRSLAEAAVVSALDLALWDLHAQRRGRRLVDALGRPRRDTVPLYANINRRTIDRTPEGFAASARAARDAGFGAFKIAPFDESTPAACARGMVALDAGLARVAAVRATLGPKARLMVDCHWRFDEAAAGRAIDALADLNVHWVECPLPENPTTLSAITRLRQRANRHGMLLAGMEQGTGVAAFEPWCRAGAYDVMMPDVKYVGGLAHFMALARLFAAHGVAMSPHNPSGPVAHAASLAVSAALPDLDLLELQFDESPLFDSLAGGQVPARDRGASALPAGPGLGVALKLPADAHVAWTRNWAAP